jgi:4-hydroxybenzoate polyprenyltransferase
MKKLLYVAIALCATTACSTENNLENTLYNVVESGANMAMDSLHQAANKELERHTGIDSLATKIGAADTINVEREIERGVKRRIIEELSK